MSEQARTPSEPYEIRMAQMGRGREELDEVIAAGKIHFERMGPDSLWCGITLPDGRELHVNVWAKKGRLGWSVLEDWPGGKECR